MLSASKILAIVLLVAFRISTTHAQEMRPLDERDLQLQRERIQAISIIKQAAAEAPLWDNKKASVQALCQAADLLWDEIPGSGRNWLTRAWELTQKVSAAPKDPNLKDFFSRSDQSDLRVMVVSVARKYDHALAEKFLRQLSSEPVTEKKDRGAFDDRTLRSEQLLQAALQTVESNPQAAFNLGEQSLADGVSYSLQSVLTSLRKKDLELANKLFDLALIRFANSDRDPAQAHVLAGYLFYSGFTFSTNTSGQTILAVNPMQQTLPSAASSEPQRARNFLIAVYELLLTQVAESKSVEGRRRSQETLVLTNRLVGPYRSFAPELLPSVQGFLAQMQRELGVDVSDTSETIKPEASTRNTTKRVTPDELYEMRISNLEEAAERKTNAIARKLAYVETALATKGEDYQRGRRIAERIDDDNLRPDVISFILYRGALALVNKGEIDNASQLAIQITDTFRRAEVRITIADRLAPNTADEQRAFSLLSEAGRDLSNEEPSTKLAKIALGRAAVMTKLDQDQGLMAIDHALEIINKLDSFDLHDESAPNLGLAISSVSGATVVTPRFGHSFSNAIKLLMPHHFEEVADTVAKLNGKEVRALAQLETAKLYLQATHPVGTTTASPHSR